MNRKYPKCHRTLPVSAFQRPGTPYRKPYCRPCMALYKRLCRTKARGKQSPAPATNVPGRPQSGPLTCVTGPRPTLVLGDLHFPWHSSPALAAAVNLARELQPDLIVQLGDLADLYSFSKYPRSHNLMTPAEETLEARNLALQMWRELRAACPDARCLQLAGNHDERITKRVLERLPEVEHLLHPSVEALFTFDGVESVRSANEELFVDSVCFLHGYMPFGRHASWNRCNTVVAHSHRGGVQMFKNAEGTYWELNVGWLGDIKAPVFSYRSQKALHGTTLGVGVIDEHGPRFIPLE